MKTIITTIFSFLVFSIFSLAQVSNYTFTTSVNSNLLPMNGSTELISSNLNNETSGVIGLGFDFWLTGQKYNLFSVNSNGLLRLGAEVVQPTPTNDFSDTNNPKIMPFWDDLITGANGKVHYLLAGASPNRKLVVEWRTNPANSILNNNSIIFQVVLSESTNVIDFIYFFSNPTSTSASIGISTTKTDYLSVSSRTNTVSSINANNLNSALSIKTGTKYSFYPPFHIPEAPMLSANDTVNKLTASHALGEAEILVSENGSAFTAYTGTISVGDVTRPVGYWKFKIKAAAGRNESIVVSSPAFTVTTTPSPPTLTANDASNILSAYHVLGTSEILVSENGTPYVNYKGQINVGNYARAAGYWKFKLKAAAQRNESPVVNSPAFAIEPVNPCSATGTILYEVWNKVSGISIQNNDWTKAANIARQLTLFEAPKNVADNYASRIRGYICPPQTGNYYLGISGDEATELWISTDGFPGNKRKVSYNKTFTGPRQWYKYSSQISRAIYLQAGKKYYIEALHKEGTGEDNLAVAWQLPDGKIEAPIPGNRLSPFVLNQNSKFLAAPLLEPRSSADLIAPGIKVIPNPVTTTVSVIVKPLISGITELTVYDFWNKRLLTIYNGYLNENISKKISFDCSSLPNGVYFIRMSNNVRAERIVVLR